MSSTALARASAATALRAPFIVLLSEPLLEVAGKLCEIVREGDSTPLAAQGLSKPAPFLVRFASRGSRPPCDNRFFNGHNAVEICGEMLAGQLRRHGKLRSSASLGFLQESSVKLNQRGHLNVRSIRARTHYVTGLRDDHETGHPRFRKICILAAHTSGYAGQRQAALESMNKPMLADDAVALPPSMQCLIYALEMVITAILRHRLRTTLTVFAARVAPTSRCTGSCSMPTRSSGGGGRRA